MKILIIGIVASGKSTLAKRLSNKLNIKCFEIDSIVHDDVKNIKRTNQNQQEIINKINKSSSWIIEGTLRKNLYNLLDLADKIIYLDIPLNLRKRRIFKRFIKQNLHLEKCNYKPSIKMLYNMYKWTNDYKDSKDIIEEKIFKYKDKLVILTSEDEINNYKIEI